MRGHYRSSDEAKARITITLPVEVEQQLRRLATQKGSAVNPIVRDWIIEKLGEFGPVPPRGPTASRLAK